MRLIISSIKHQQQKVMISDYSSRLLITLKCLLKTKDKSSQSIITYIKDRPL